MARTIVKKIPGNAPEPISTKANMLWSSAGSMTYLACQWLVTVLVVRLSVTGFDAAGLLTLATSVVGIFGTFANYKMGTFQISDVRKEHELGEYLAFRFVTLGIAFVGCMVYALFTCPLSSLVTIALYYVFNGVDLISSIFRATTQVGLRMDYNGKSFMARGVSTLLAFAVAFWFTQSLDWAIVAMTVVSLVVVVFYDAPCARQFEPIKLRITKEKTWYFLKVSFPAVAASLACSALFAIPKQYLLISMGEAALGIYGSVSAPALIIQMGAQYIYNPLLTLYPRYYFAQDKQGLRSLMVKTVLGMLAVIIVCVVGLETAGPWLLGLLFGDEILQYTYILMPIMIMTGFTAFLWFFGDLLIAFRDFKGYLIACVVALIVVLPLTFICVDLWGMNGVSIACSVASGVGVALLVIFFLKTVHEGWAKMDQESAHGKASSQSNEEGTSGEGVDKDQGSKRNSSYIADSEENIVDEGSDAVGSEVQRTTHGEETK